MGIRQFKKSIIIFMFFSCASVLGVISELILVTILSGIIIFLLYLAIMVIMTIYFQIDYDEIKSLYDYLENIRREKLKTQISCNMERETIEDKVLEYNAQMRIIGNKIILDAEHCLSNNRYKKMIPKELYEMQAENILKFIEKTKKIIKEC